MNKLIVVPSNPPAQIGADDAADHLHAALDRAVSNIAWSADGQSISFLLQDDRTQSRRDGAGGESERHAMQRKTHRPPRRSQAPSPGKDGNFAVLATDADQVHRGLCARRREPAPADETQRDAARRAAAGDDRRFPVEEQGRHRGPRPDRQAGRLQGRHEVSDAARSSTAARTGRISMRSRSTASSSPPTATWCSRSTIAAAPDAATRFRRRFTPTGATSKSSICWARWTRRCKQGIADPARLGIGGWSYGGISTDYTIASDTRFKAAISGAGSSHAVHDVRHRPVHRPVRPGDGPAVEERRTSG